LQGQVKKEYVAREPELAQYLAKVKALEWRFQGFTLKYIYQEQKTQKQMN
jgi:hypothetical protein